MRRRLAVAVGLLGILLMPSWAATAQTKATQGKDSKAKELRVDGTIRGLDTTAHTFTVKVRTQIAERQVMYNDSTKFTFRNKAASASDLKEGSRVIVLGTPDEKNQIVARRIDIREGS
jgi:hypothetical protein